MEFRSTAIGGTTEPLRGSAGAVPDVRLTLSSQAIEAMSTLPDMAVQHKGIGTLDASKYPGIEYLISGIGSSSLVDTDGDIFHRSALEGMMRDSIDLNVILNHIPTLPWNIAGSVLETSLEFVKDHSGGEHAALRLVSDIEKKHPDAWRTYEMMAGIDCRKRKFGYSVGCLYVDAKARTTSTGIYKGADVFDVMPVEYSLVTMPANRLAWVDTFSRDLQEKGVLPRRPNFISKQQYAASQGVVEVITDWMDFGPVVGPKLERLADFFEKEYGIVYARRPRST